MAKIIKPLTDSECQNAKARDTAYDLLDGSNLNLRVYPSGTKTWRWKYKKAKGAKYESPITLGNYPALSLKAARQKREYYESMLADGRDPKTEITRQQAKESGAITLESIVKAWLCGDHHSQKKALNKHTQHKKLRKFENHLFPKFKKVSIESVTLRDLREALNEIYRKSPDTAQRIRNDLIKVFSFAVQYNYIETNIARDLDLMDLSHVKRHRAVFDKIDSRIPDLIHKIKQDTGQPLTKLFLLITLHIFIRSSELRYARWSEIDFDKKIWSVPKSRELIDGVRHSDRGAKLNKAYEVFLSRQTIDLLKQVYDISGNSHYVFPSTNSSGKFLSENTANNALRRMGYTKEDLCLHGFRAIARSTLQEMGIFTYEALERQLNHTEKNANTDAYKHIAHHIDERIIMMTIWSDWLELVEKEGFVSPYEYGKRYERQQRESNFIQPKSVI
ncbi:Prophage CP4-57 integrase [Acinetobacter venetianus]|uniref:Prophage CP4-57 integrase n=1 Tax=Acinetobacter venetianus TaxID=52133 RepID=A0A150HKQ3_9GAMM|nr:integrase arm-type DNA-binding domain-containing protein [Acinetobacter venetianus]KXZ65105.1 Prophage CP4-57 integrase [Acinetobacter venetianus]